MRDSIAEKEAELVTGGACRKNELDYKIEDSEVERREEEQADGAEEVVYKE